MLSQLGVPQSLRRTLWLTVGVVAGAAIFLVPILVFAPHQVPAPVAVAQFLACGVLLGLGRQGVDILELRLLAASLALLVGALISQQQQHGNSACPDVGTYSQSLLWGGSQ